MTNKRPFQEIREELANLFVNTDHIQDEYDSEPLGNLVFWLLRESGTMIQSAWEEDSKLPYDLSDASGKRLYSHLSHEVIIPLYTATRYQGIALELIVNYGIHPTELLREE